MSSASNCGFTPDELDDYHSPAPVGPAFQRGVTAKTRRRVEEIPAHLRGFAERAHTLAREGTNRRPCDIAAQLCAEYIEPLR